MLIYPVRSKTSKLIKISKEKWKLQNWSIKLEWIASNGDYFSAFSSSIRQLADLDDDGRLGRPVSLPLYHNKGVNSVKDIYPCLIWGQIKKEPKL